MTKFKDPPEVKASIAAFFFRIEDVFAPAPFLGRAWSVFAFDA